jgi:hypothetical protein
MSGLAARSTARAGATAVPRSAGIVLTVSLAVLVACDDHTPGAAHREPAHEQAAHEPAAHEPAAHEPVAHEPVAHEHAAHEQPAHPQPTQPGPAAAPPAANPVQHEMRLLTSALETAVRSIGQGDVRPVAHELHRVHLAKEATQAAIEAGRYRTPRNPEQLERFRALDEAFHGDLGRLVQASSRNDVAATAEALGAVLQRCQGCHSQFRP